MSIIVTCQCGKQLTAKDEFAGKRVKCPGCGGPLLIPQPQKAAQTDDGISDLLDDAGMRAGVVRCPGCGAELNEQAILCVMCGFDLRKGHRIKTRVGTSLEFDDEDLGEIPVHGVAELDMAERRMARDKVEQKNLSKGAPWWLILIAFLGVVGFGVGMYMAPQDQVFRNSGYVLMIGGGLLGTWYGLRIWITAFKEAPVVGILYLFPPYAIYFIFSRWDRVAGLFLLSLLGTIIMVVGWVMPMMAHLFEAEDKPQYGLKGWQHPTVAVKVFHDPVYI